MTEFVIEHETARGWRSWRPWVRSTRSELFLRRVQTTRSRS